jgi:hypothetical protein
MNGRQRARRLRSVAQHLEETVLPAVANLSKIPTPLRSGGPQEFPRPSMEDQAAKQGITVMRETIEEIVVKLYALALAYENDQEVPEALLVSVQPYIDSFDSEQKAEGSTDG